MKKKTKTVLSIAMLLAMVLTLMPTFSIMGSPAEWPEADDLQTMSDAEILRLFNDDSIAFGENCTEAAFTRREYAQEVPTGGPEDQFTFNNANGLRGFNFSEEIVTKAFNELLGIVEPYADPFFREGYTFTNSAKKEINIYVNAVDFPDVIGNVQIPYGLHRNINMWNNMIVDLSRVETHVAGVFGGTNGGGARSTQPGALPIGTEVEPGSYGRIRGWTDPDFATKLAEWNTTVAAYKGAAQRLEEQSMGRMKINIICLNEVYAKLCEEAGLTIAGKVPGSGEEPVIANEDWWPWFRMPGPMISYAVQGPADCEDYNQFARVHGAGIEKAREMIAALGTPEAEKVLTDMGTNGDFPIDLIYTIVPHNLFGHRAGLQGGGGLDTSFSFNDQAGAIRDTEYRHENGVRIEGRNIGSGVFGVKNIWSALAPSSAPNIFLHEFYHGLGQFDDYSFGWMTGPNTGENNSMTSSWTRDQGDRYGWRKFRNGWITDDEVAVVMPGESKTVFIPALGAYDEAGAPYDQTRLVVIPKEWRSRDTFGDPVGWRNDWNGYRQAYNWYDWFTNPWLGGATHSVKSWATFLTLESRRSMGSDNVIATNIEGIVIGYLANPTTETGHGMGGWKIVSGTAGLNAARAGAVTTYNEPHIGLTVTVLESTAYGDLVRIEYTGVPTNAAQHVYQAELTVDDGYATTGEDFTVGFDILTIGAPAPNDAQNPGAGAIARVATPLGVPGGVSGFVMQVTFDAAKFEYKGVAPGVFDYAVDTARAAEGVLVVTATGTKMVDKATILALTFKALAVGEYKNAINATITDVTLINWRGAELKKGDVGFDDVGTFTGALPAFPTTAWVQGNLAVRGTLSAIYNTVAANTYTPGIQAWGLTALNTEYKSGTATSRLLVKGADVTVTDSKIFTISGNVYSDTPGPDPYAAPEVRGSSGVWTPIAPLTPKTTGDFGKWVTGTWIGLESDVELIDSTGAVVRKTTSDWDGVYSIPGVPEGVYTLRISKPKYNQEVISALAVAANVTKNVQLTRETFQVSGTIYVDLETSTGTARVPAGAGVDVYILSIGNAYRVLGKGVTDADGKYVLQSSSDNYDRPFCAVAVDVNTLNYGKGIIGHQMALKGTGTNGIKRGEVLELNLGRLFGMDPGDRVWPSNTTQYGAGGSYNFRVDNTAGTLVVNRRTDRDVTLTYKQELHFRTTDKNTATTYQLHDYATGAAIGGVVTSLGNANGDDIIFDVPPGRYYVEVMRPGFVTMNTFPVAVDTMRIFMRNAASSNTLQINTSTTNNTNLVTGNVIDAITGLPIPGAEVVFVGYGATSGKGNPALADAAGRFSYDTVTGAKDIVVSKQGYAPATIYLASGGFTNRDIELMPEYSVKFVDWDGTLIIERKVLHGGDAKVPYKEPFRGGGWIYMDWGVDFTNVTSDLVVNALYLKLDASAFVTKLTGNQNDLTITVTETWSDGKVATPTNTLKIANNAEGTYSVGKNNVYVDTKGNTQIREIYIKNPPAPGLGIDRPRDNTPVPGKVILVKAATNAKDVKISGSSTWDVSFSVTETYSDGSVKTVPYTVKINKNSSGKADLGAYTLVYDIAGNGSNIKAFNIVMK